MRRRSGAAAWRVLAWFSVAAGACGDTRPPTDGCTRQGRPSDPPGSYRTGPCPTGWQCTLLSRDITFTCAPPCSGPADCAGVVSDEDGTSPADCCAPIADAAGRPTGRGACLRRVRDRMCLGGCEGPRMVCGGACVDVASDAMNCGACGTRCGAGERCEGGRCVVGGSSTCRGCRSGADCPGSVCGQRHCDGRRGCAPAGGMAACTTIDDVPCPAVAVYHPCADHSQCSVEATCEPVYPGVTARVCTPACTRAEDCPPVPAGGVGVVYCASATGRCLLGCERAGACTAELACRRDNTGRYAYCF